MKILCFFATIRPMSELIEKLQLNLQTYANATNVTVQLLDENNNVLSWYGPTYEYCRCFQEGSGRYCPCDKTHSDSCAQARSLGDAYIYLCPAGLTHFVVSVFKDNSFQGSVLAGPIALEFPDMENVEDVMRKFNISLEYRRKLYTSSSSVPLIEPFQARHLSKLLFLLVTNLMAGETERRMEAQKKSMQQAHIGEFIRLAKEEPVNTSYYADERRLANFMLSGDLEGARAYLNDMLGKIYFTSGNNLDIIKVRCLELISTLSHTMYDAGVNEETVYEMTDKYMRDSSNAKDLTELSYLLMETLELFTNLTFSERVGGSELIRKALAYMSKYYNQDLTLSSVARHVSLNPSYFSNLFKKETGTNFSTYLSNIRIENAKLLLKDSNLALSEIALELGFESQSYFSKVFKEHEGLTPRQYRQQL